jgi:hypothetical protein
MLHTKGVEFITMRWVKESVVACAHNKDKKKYEKYNITFKNDSGV